MPKSLCQCCGGESHWQWEEAFDKFGFNDGDGQVETGQVAKVLERAGYSVKAEPWGMHNTTIISIKHGGHELMPLEASNITIGYDCPRMYLPDDVIALLDQELPYEDDA